MIALTETWSSAFCGCSSLKGLRFQEVPLPLHFFEGHHTPKLLYTYNWQNLVEGCKASALSTFKDDTKKGVRVFFVRFGIHAVLLQLIQAVFVKKDWDGNPTHSKSEK